MTKTLIVAIIAITVVGGLSYLIRKNNSSRILNKVSDEGYETAHDILYPYESKRNKNLRYGPVIPAHD